MIEKCYTVESSRKICGLLLLSLNHSWRGKVNNSDQAAVGYPYRSSDDLRVKVKSLIRPSKNSLMRVAATTGSSVLAAAAAGLATKKISTAALTGTAVLAAQASSFIGDVHLGRAVSKARLVSEGIARDARDWGVAAGQLKSLQGAVHQIQTKPAQAVKTVVQKAAGEVYPAADPRTRRIGAPAGNSGSPVVRSRARIPLSGEEAKKWVESRTGGNSCEAKETAPSFRASAVPFADEVPVAMIADDFTYYSFRTEFQTLRLTPSNWRKVFDKHKPALFFCESAWQGGSPEKHPWQGRIYASVRWPKENRKDLLEILDYCHKHKIPTVFWNKEDPTHFSDRINDFVRTAALFDYVFTTAAECVEDYKKYAGCNYVDVLPFAVQPRLFNPLGRDKATDTVNFAGTWYGMYPDRCEAQAAIMDQALDAGLDLVIYDRMKSSPNPIYRYPERFDKYTREPIRYEETADAYRESKFGITLNTVADSQTMFARRAFELAGSGNVVLSNEAKGVRQFFGDAVIYADSNPDALSTLTAEQYYDLQRRALNIALSNTYRHRAEKVLETVGVHFQSRMQKPALVQRVATFSEYKLAVEQFQAEGTYSELLVVVTSTAEQSLEFKLLQERVPNVTVINQRSIEQNEFRTRSFLQSSHFVLGGGGESRLSAADLEELRLHTAYFDGQIRFADNAGERYKTSEEALQVGSLVSTGLLKHSLLGLNVPTLGI